jgi:hypothetical protein
MLRRRGALTVCTAVRVRDTLTHLTPMHPRCLLAPSSSSRLHSSRHHSTSPESSSSSSSAATSTAAAAASTEKLESFFNTISSMSFLTRVFRWAPVQQLSYEAFGQYKSILDRDSDNKRASQSQSAEIAEHRYVLSLKESELSVVQKQLNDADKQLAIGSSKIDFQGRRPQDLFSQGGSQDKPK